MTIVAILLLTTALIVGWVTQLLGLGGNWLIVAAAALYVWLLPPDAAAAIGWPVVGVLLVLATLGEVVEFAAGAAGVKSAGGSRRGAVLAIAGSIIGSIAGMFVGVPVPIIGSLIAAVFFGAIGALVGAVLGETWKGHGFDKSIEIGKAAFIGRMLGTLAKTIVSTMMVVLTLGALVL